MPNDPIATPVDAFLRALSDPAIVVDPAGGIAAYNLAAGSLFTGLRREEALSLALRDPDALTAVAEVLAGGEPREIEHVRHVPDERIFVLRVAPLEGVGALLLFRDVSEARRIEKMRVDFVANASHELRTPLAALIGAVDTLLGPARNDAAAQSTFLNMMREQAQRMRRLVDDLLSLSRIESKGAVVPRDRVDLKATVNEASNMLSGLAQEHGTTVDRQVPTADAGILGDRDEMARLAENLIENAIRHGRLGGRVTVALARRDGYVDLSVTDDGPGIPPQHIPRLTERFYRAEPRDGRGRTGTGLGLAIVKHIVQRHGGRLMIESEVGRGSTFRVRLPAAPEA